jgi:hypothetical protein
MIIPRNIKPSSSFSNSNKTNSTINITPSQMFNMIHKTGFGGIFGYNPKKKYFDYYNSLWIKERARILLSYKHKHWPPNDWPKDKEGNKKLPIKKSFIDDKIEWYKSFNDENKRKNLIEELESKGKKIDFEKNIYKSDFDIKKNKKNLRSMFLKREIEIKKIKDKIKYEIPAYKSSIIEQAIEKIKKDNENKINKKAKSFLSKSDKISYISEAEYLGEQIPFYNSYKNKKNDNDKKLFNPNRLILFKKNPSWSFAPKNFKKDIKNIYIEKKENLIKEKQINTLSKSGLDLNSYKLDVIKSYDMINKHGSLPHLFRKQFDYKSTNQYKKALENNKSSILPGPGTYWNDEKCLFNNNINDKKENNRYYMTRDKTDKRNYVKYINKNVI